MPLTSLLKALPFRKGRAEASRLRMVVIGAGRMGHFHLKRLFRHPEVQLTGVVDAHFPRAAQAAREFRSTAFSTFEPLLAQLDAAIVATPTTTHFAIGRALLQAGVSCLIEKPLTSTLPEAQTLIDLAETTGAILQVGHIERFNPAVLEAARHVQDPKFIEVNRLGPYDPRVADIGVIMDLMIHDLDIVLFLVGKEVLRVEAVGAQVLSQHEDIAKVRLHFAGGCIADLSASRISLKKYRQIRIFQKNAYLSIDYAAPALRVYRKKGDVVRSLSDVEILKPKLAKKDPLSLELDHFLDCVRRRQTPLVSGRHGRDALHLAQEVLNHLQIHA
jgi:predicted dehydrogenase